VKRIILEKIVLRCYNIEYCDTLNIRSENNKIISVTSHSWMPMYDIEYCLYIIYGKNTMGTLSLVIQPVCKKKKSREKWASKWYIDVGLFEHLALAAKADRVG